MARNTLAVEYQTPAGQVQVYRLNNGAFIAVGNPFTPGGMVTQGDEHGHNNLAIEFAGSLYCIVGGAEVRKFNPGTQNWDVETLPAFTISQDVQFTGLHVGWSSAGVPRLFFTFIVSGTNTPRACYLEPGGSWTLGAAGPTASISSGVGPSGYAMFRNSLFLQSGTHELVYDVGTDAWTVQNFGTGEFSTYVRARGRLFRFAEGSGLAYVNVYEFIGGAWSLIKTGGAAPDDLGRNDAGGFPGINTNAGSAMGRAGFYDAALDLILFFGWQDDGANPNRGMRAFTFDPDTLTVVDITATIVPAAIRYGGAGITTSLNGSGKIAIQVDNETDPTAQTVTVWAHYDAGQWEGFTYTDNATLMTSIGAGGDPAIAISHQPSGGGEYFYEGSSTTDPHRAVLEVAARVPIPGGTRMFFTAWLFDETGGAPSVTDLTLGIYFNKTTEGGKGKPGPLGAITGAARVSGSGSVPVLNAGKVDNVTPDGNTVYSVDWNAVGAVQVADGEFHQLAPRLEV